MRSCNYENIKTLGKSLSLVLILGLTSATAQAAPDMNLSEMSKSTTHALFKTVSMVVPYKITPPAPMRKPNPKISGTTLAIPPGTPETMALARPAQPLTAFDRGISAYRTHNLRAALTHFAETADNDRLNDFERAAGAFWAARVADQMGKAREARSLRHIAARFPQSFYGQIAAAQLGQALDLNWDHPMSPLAAMTRIQNHPQGSLVLDHIAHGRLSAADQALLQMAHGADAELRLAIASFAIHHGLPATALKLARTIETDTGHRYDSAYYPVGVWMNAKDFRVDRALVHAIVRQESGFNPNARSNMGAIGLMQLLPSTASYVVKVRAGGRMDTTDLTPARRNLDVGQHYLQYLFDYKGVDGDVMNMLIAYNAGPGNLIKWQKNYADAAEDPLLFIEVIPAKETRDYIEKVMASYWIYRARFGQNNPTLVSVAAGKGAPLGAPTPATAATAAPPTPWFAGLKLDRLARM